jgi:hypothetical protein
MLSPAFWVVQGVLIAVMIAMTARGEWNHQARQRQRLAAGGPVETTDEADLVPLLDGRLAGFTPSEQARLWRLRASVRAARLGPGARWDDVRAS